MIRDLDLEASARQQLTRLIDQIDVDAPQPVDEPRRAAWARPMVTVAAGLVLVAAGVIAVEVSNRGTQHAVEVTAPQSNTEILWSSYVSPDDQQCPREDLPDLACSVISYASRDGQLVLTGTESGLGAQIPEAVHLQYRVDGEVDELTLQPTPGEVSGDVQEWSVEVPSHVPQLVDPATRELTVDYFIVSAVVDQDRGYASWRLFEIHPDLADPPGMINLSDVIDPEA